jgi:hypothetical protein
MVATPIAIAGLSAGLMEKAQIYLAKDKTEFPSEISRAISNETYRSRSTSDNMLFSQEYKIFSGALRSVLREHDT